MIPSVVQRPMSFDELLPGQAFTAGPRIVSRADIDAFATLSGDKTALHSDESYARTTPFGGVVAHGALVLSVATGLAYDSGIFQGTVLAVRSMDISFDRPVFPGDALSLELKVRSKDERPRLGRGRVTFAIAVTNQANQPTLTGSWVVVLRRTDDVPGSAMGADPLPGPPV